MPSTQKQRPGHITTINHAPVLSGTLAELERDRVVCDDMGREREREIERERERVDE